MNWKNSWGMKGKGVKLPKFPRNFENWWSGIVPEHCPYPWKNSDSSFLRYCIVVPYLTPSSTRQARVMISYPIRVALSNGLSWSALPSGGHGQSLIEKNLNSNPTIHWRVELDRIRYFLKLNSNRPKQVGCVEFASWFFIFYFAFLPSSFFLHPPSSLAT